MVSDLTVIKHNHSKSKYPIPQHTHKQTRNNVAAPGPSTSHATRTLTKIPILLCRKITKPVGDQTRGKEPGREIRRTATKKNRE